MSGRSSSARPSRPATALSQRGSTTADRPPAEWCLSMNPTLSRDLSPAPLLTHDEHYEASPCEAESDQSGNPGEQLNDGQRGAHRSARNQARGREQSTGI